MTIAMVMVMTMTVMAKVPLISWRGRCSANCFSINCVSPFSTSHCLLLCVFPHIGVKRGSLIRRKRGGGGGGVNPWAGVLGQRHTPQTLTLAAPPSHQAFLLSCVSTAISNYRSATANTPQTLRLAAPPATKLVSCPSVSSCHCILVATSTHFCTS